jgi:hypothetical protein
VHLDAGKRTWKNVTHSYSMDFGEVVRDSPRVKRQSFDKTFTLDLASTGLLSL